MANNVYNNIAKITTKSLESVHNNVQMANRVARRWDKDFNGSGQIGNTLNIRVPGFYGYTVGASAVPTGLNDTYVPLTLLQGNVSCQLKSVEMELNVDDFQHNVVEPMIKDLVQKIDANIIASANFNQFAGTIGTSVANLTPFLTAKAIAATQSACPVNGELHMLCNEYMAATAIGGLAQYFNPTAEISEQYKTGRLGNNSGINFFTSANAPSQTLGTWSGTLTVTTTLPTDGATSFTIAGMTGTFAAGEHFTIAGVHAVNPRGKAVQGQLKQFVVTGQVGATVSFSPAMSLTGPLQNIDALPISTAAVYPWGNSAATALSAGTGQVVSNSLYFHEDALAFGMADLDDVSGVMGVGKASARAKDDQTGLRIRAATWWNGQDDYSIFRLDILAGSCMLRQGFGTNVVQ